jgi:hypothetical protein
VGHFNSSTVGGHPSVSNHPLTILAYYYYETPYHDKLTLFVELKTLKFDCPCHVDPLLKSTLATIVLCTGDEPALIFIYFIALNPDPQCFQPLTKFIARRQNVLVVRIPTQQEGGFNLIKMNIQWALKVHISSIKNISLYCIANHNMLQ